MIRGITARTKTARTFSIQKQIYWRFNWTRNNLNGISTCFKTRIYYNLRCVKTYWHIYSAFTTRKWCIIWVETKWEQVKGGFSPWMTNYGSRFQSGPWTKGAGLPSLYSRPKSFVLHLVFWIVFLLYTASKRKKQYASETFRSFRVRLEAHQRLFVSDPDFLTKTASCVNFLLPFWFLLSPHSSSLHGRWPRAVGQPTSVSKRAAFPPHI